MRELINKVFRVALLNFVIVAFFGLLLRLKLWQNVIPVNYNFLLNAHSHFALGGWMFTAFFLAVAFFFVPDLKAKKTTYLKIFLLSQIGCFGMLFSFTYKGYFFLSIALSQVYVFSTYWFTYQVWKDLKTPTESVLWIKTSLVFLVLSSLGPYAVGPMMVTSLKHSAWYYDAIYFYLHFQYNGWLTFAVFALIVRQFETENIQFSVTRVKQIRMLMIVSCLLTYFLSVLWSKPGLVFNFIGGVGAALQIVASVLFIQLLINIRGSVFRLYEGNKLVVMLGLLSLFSYMVKIGLQFLSAFPSLAQAAYTYRNFIVAYLHLTLIGFISFALLSIFIKARLLRLSYGVSIGVFVFTFAFVASELVLVAQAWSSWLQLQPFSAFHTWMLVFTIAMLGGLLVVFCSQFTPLTSYFSQAKKPQYETS